MYSSIFPWHVDNYINESTGSLFIQYCTENNIEVSVGGCPDFSLASTISSNLPPTLLYRVVTLMNSDSNTSNVLDHLHYSDFYSMGNWCSDEGKPIVGIQLFFYGAGLVTAKLVGSNGSVVYGNGECGNLILTDQLCPVTAIEFGSKDTDYSIVGMSNQVNGVVVEVKLNLVANSYFVC